MKRCDSKLHFKKKNKIEGKFLFKDTDKLLEALEAIVAAPRLVGELEKTQRGTWNWYHLFLYTKS